MKKNTLLLLFQFLALVLFAQDSLQKEEIFMVAEKMPEFPGGKEEMDSWIQANMQYPVKELLEQVSGTVFVTMLIDKEGRIKEARVLRGVENGAGLDAEAIRLMQTMPLWYSGKQNGKAVNVQYSLPVKFDVATASFPESAYCIELTKAENGKKYTLRSGRIKYLLKVGNTEPTMARLVQITKDSLFVQAKISGTTFLHGFPLSDVAALYIKTGGAKVATVLAASNNVVPFRRDIFKKIDLYAGWQAKIVSSEKDGTK